MSIFLRNGKIFLNGKLEEKNLFISEGKIKKITKKFLEADEVIDCSNKIILPGAIDSHVHFMYPGATHKEDWITGSEAAAAGGVTTVLDMPNNSPPCTSIEVLKDKIETASNDSLINFGFFFGAAKNNLEEIKKLNGCIGVKIYAGSSTGNLLVDSTEKIKEIFSNSNKSMVIHAENEEILNANLEKAKKLNWNNAIYHNKIRTNEAEEKAVKDVLAIQKETGNKVIFTHLSTKEAVALIKEAKQKGRKVFGDTCPQFLFFNEKVFKEKGNYAKCNPSIKSEEDRQALWKGIKDGTLEMICSDHAPHTKEEKEQEYFKAPSGIPGVQNMVPLMLNEAGKGNIKLVLLVKLLCENPAKIYGIKNKGFIKEGFDADLIVVDLNREFEIKNDEQLSKCGWTIYDGMKVKGFVEKTFVNGELVFDNNEIIPHSRGKLIEAKK